jgi:ribosomal protein S27E
LVLRASYHRTELIRGYEENAQRIPLQGLTATVITGETVQIRIEGPDTKFVYRNAFDAEFNLRRAQQFAALLNYEASLQGAPPKTVQEKPPTTSGAPQTDTTTTKVRCLHCQHVQTVPVSQKTFSCEQCKAHLKRRTAPATSS